MIDTELQTEATRLYDRFAERSKLLGRRLKKSEVIEEICAFLAVRLRPKGRKKAAISQDAESIYQLYPKKVGKEEALVAITKALKKHPKEYLMDKTNQFALAVNSWPSSYRYGSDGADFCPHPSTWFNRGSYEDDPREWKRFGAKNRAPHQYIPPPEPEGWRDRFPDFVDRDKKWENLDPMQHKFITETLSISSGMESTAREIEHEQRLRNA